MIARLSDGSTAIAELRYGEQIGIGDARIPLAGGVTIVSSTSS